MTQLKLLVLIVSGLLTMASAGSFKQQVVTEELQVQSARGVIKRIAPKIAKNFILKMIPKEGNLDVFEIESRGTKIILRGSSGVALASGFNHYLKTYCKCHVSWCGDQLTIPKPLPKVPKKVRVVCLHKHRVYFNYCTLNYTASWWDWKRWEREIDIMALNGINMPLSPTGLEAVWYYSLLKVGYTDEDARNFLVGPAFFAWQWMTNIQSHGGPLPKEWIDSHIVLGQKILERQRALGMTPIQQGFSGYVPNSFTKKFPKASVSQGHRWCKFPKTSQLDPLDPSFKTFGKIFLETQSKLFGTSHVYAADPFHEGRPPKSGDDYLNKVGTEIWNLLHEFDPKATWAMQAWSIREQIANQVPKDRLLVLDLSGRRNDFWGYEFVKGQLHNFGGRINLHGDLPYVADNPFAKVVKETPLCAGMGLFMEGIEQNPVFYQMVFDMIWRDQSVVAEDWLNSYTERRYGRKSENAQKAWKLLLDGPYKRGTNGVESSSIIAARPALKPRKSGPNAGFRIPYNTTDLFKAWQLLLADKDSLGACSAYQFDVMDVGRQVLSNLGQEYVKDAAMAFNKRDRKTLKKVSGEFLELLADVDRLLSTRDEFSYDRWVRNARSWGQTEELKNYYEYNAAMLVTTWGPEKSPYIFDYGWREWGGLIRLYYLPRWQVFYDHLDTILAENKHYQDPKKTSHGRHSLRANSFYSKLADWEIAWVQKPQKVRAAKTGDTLAIATELADKYANAIQYAYSKEHKALLQAHARSQQKSEHGTAIGTWKPRNITSQWKHLTMDVTKHFDEAANYDITFVCTDGMHPLEISSVELLQNDTPIATDTHTGTTRGKHKKTAAKHSKNVYTLEMKDVAFGTKYKIRAKVKGVNGRDSYGTIWIKKRK